MLLLETNRFVLWQRRSSSAIMWSHRTEDGNIHCNNEKITSMLEIRWSKHALISMCLLLGIQFKFIQYSSTAKLMCYLFEP